MSESEFQKWADIYQKLAIEGTELLWPSETLIRCFKGNYIPELEKNYEGKKIIDIGFGSGNNLIFLGSLGLSLFGMEVHDEICTSVRRKLQQLGYSADLRMGKNINIPFPDNFFDFLISWNVLHYEKDEEDILAAIKEYHRILKPGGRFFLSTTGPEHKILENAQALRNHRYLIGKADDFRKGQIFFYFDSEIHLQSCFNTLFYDLRFGRIQDFLFTDNLDWFIMTGVKK